MTLTLSAITASIIRNLILRWGSWLRKWKPSAKHGLGNSGMVIKPDEKGYLYLRYNDLLAPMIRAIQELDDASEAKDRQIAALERRLQSQQKELLAVVQTQLNKSSS